MFYALFFGGGGRGHILLALQSGLDLMGCLELNEPKLVVCNDYYSTITPAPSDISFEASILYKWL